MWEISILFWYPHKRVGIIDEILNRVMDAEETFKNEQSRVINTCKIINCQKVILLVSSLPAFCNDIFP